MDCAPGRYADEGGMQTCKKCKQSTDTLAGATVSMARADCKLAVTYRQLPVMCVVSLNMPHLGHTCEPKCKSYECSSSDLKPCVQGCEKQQMQFKRGWRPLPNRQLDKHVAAVFECPVTKACPASQNATTCAVGYGGLLCTVCDLAAGYRKASNNQCVLSSSCWLSNVLCAVLRFQPIQPKPQQPTRINLTFSDKNRIPYA